jgi:hypothetical protein
MELRLVPAHTGSDWDYHVSEDTKRTFRLVQSVLIDAQRDPGMIELRGIIGLCSSSVYRFDGRAIGSIRIGTKSAVCSKRGMEIKLPSIR